jgi:hypothetical protein
MLLVEERSNLAVTIGSQNFEAQFDDIFTIGPGCLDLIMETLNVINHFVNSDHLPTDDTTFKILTKIFHITNGISHAALKCLHHLWFKHQDTSGIQNLFALIASSMKNQHPSF